MPGTTRRRAGEGGSAAAEFAVALPAVALVLAVCLDAVGLAALGVRLHDAAADAARSLGRGEALAVVEARADDGVPGALIDAWSEGETVCVTLASTARVAGLVPVHVAATSCALAGGR